MVSGNAMFQTHILDLFYPTTIPSRLATVDLEKKELSVSTIDQLVIRFSTIDITF